MSPKVKIESTADEKLSHKDGRRIPRSYPVVQLPIYDVDDPTVEGLVQDLSEKGVQVSGILTEVDQRKTFFIQANEFAAVNPFSFEAECRWVRTSSGDDQCVSGFEITWISDKDLEELRSAIELLAISD
jgi:hypothetical protein